MQISKNGILYTVDFLLKFGYPRGGGYVKHMIKLDRPKLKINKMFYHLHLIAAEIMEKHLGF